MKVIWSERARMQVQEIFEYIAEDRPMAAERILDGFLKRVDLLLEFPEQGAAWGTTLRSDLRFIIFESYRLIYRLSAEEIAVLSVRHTRMQPEEPSIDSQT